MQQDARNVHLVLEIFLVTDFRFSVQREKSYTNRKPKGKRVKIKVVNHCLYKYWYVSHSEPHF